MIVSWDEANKALFAVWLRISAARNDDAIVANCQDDGDLLSQLEALSLLHLIIDAKIDRIAVCSSSRTARAVESRAESWP